jgi:6-phosphogluconate dehydrogenase
MEIGFVGLGRMGLNMTRRLLKGGHTVVAWDRDAAPVQQATSEGARGVGSLEEMARALQSPRTVWAMIPAGAPVDAWIASMEPLLGPSDLLVDGGNSSFKDSRRRHDALAAKNLWFVDAGTSGGIWGLENGFCLMVGGEPAAIQRLQPALETLAPPQGWMHVGPSGAGHFCKMVHNGIEYGMMESYAEGFEILQSGDYRYDLAKVAALWNRGSVVRSWLLELAQLAFERDPGLEKIRGWVEDSGEGRWTVEEAIAHGVPAPVLAMSLFRRFESRQTDALSNRVLAALRNEFGGHAVKEK